jgi:hypothetical protein
MVDSFMSEELEKLPAREADPQACRAAIHPADAGRVGGGIYVN